MKKLAIKPLQEFIIKRVKASLQEIKALEEYYEMETVKGAGEASLGINPEVLDLVSRATRMVTHDDPNAVSRFYRIARHMMRSKSDPMMYATPEEYYTDMADEFLSMATNEEGVSDNDGETPRMTPDEFTRVDRLELGKAVEQHFSR